MSRASTIGHRMEKYSCICPIENIFFVLYPIRHRPSGCCPFRSDAIFGFLLGFGCSLYFIVFWIIFNQRRLFSWHPFLAQVRYVNESGGRPRTSDPQVPVSTLFPEGTSMLPNILRSLDKLGVGCPYLLSIRDKDIARFTHLAMHASSAFARHK